MLSSDARMQLHLVNEAILRLDIAQETRTLSESEAQLLRDLKHHVQDGRPLRDHAIDRALP